MFIFFMAHRRRAHREQIGAGDAAAAAGLRGPVGSREPRFAALFLYFSLSLFRDVWAVHTLSAQDLLFVGFWTEVEAEKKRFCPRFFFLFFFLTLRSMKIGILGSARARITQVNFYLRGCAELGLQDWRKSSFLGCDVIDQFRGVMTARSIEALAFLCFGGLLYRCKDIFFFFFRKRTVVTPDVHLEKMVIKLDESIARVE